MVRLYDVNQENRVSGHGVQGGWSWGPPTASTPQRQGVLQTRDSNGVTKRRLEVCLTSCSPPPPQSLQTPLLSHAH